MVYIVLHNWESVRICEENTFVIEWDILPIDGHIFPVKVWSKVETSKTDIKCNVLSSFFDSYLD